MQYGLYASLDLIVYEEGLHNVIFWHHHLAEATCYYKSPLVNVEEVQCHVSQGVGLNKIVVKVFQICHLGKF
jgi:hypothetical protein